MKTPPTTAGGFGELLCVACGEHAVIRVSLETLDGDDALRCESCDNTFSLDSVRDVIDRWQRVIDWLATMPGGRRPNSAA